MTVTVAAAALILSAGPAIADDDWVGPDRALCGGSAEVTRGFDVFFTSEGVFFVPERGATPCADTNDPHDSLSMD
ncbi:hypothetical protein [Nonomuraea sp. NPDC049400]|uniref:hypothetical protein n=1 Tax=Nonomuraea sp. NPDC049400 TaxID=3364352 RepID=UPI0037A9B22D